MADRSSGATASWFLIGFLTGVAATLATLIFVNGRPVRQAEAAPAPAAVITYTPPRVSLPRRSMETPPESASPSAITAPAEPDEQVQEDAAAAGMTSRTQSSARDLH